MKTLITPSILSADFGHLQAEVASVESFADWLQVDVMDGHFVPNLSFGAPVVKGIKTKLPIDIHLMVSNPADRIAEFQALGAKHITFHAEAVQSEQGRKDIIKAIRSTGATAGIALNPETPIDAIADTVEDIDLVLIMSVHPGFGGQMFIPSVLEKIKALRAAHPTLMIQIDGGIDDKNVVLAKAAGANNIVAGSFIFRASDREAAIAALRK